MDYIDVMQKLWILSLLILGLFLGGAGVTAEATATEHPDPELRTAILQAIGEADSFQDRFEAEVWLVDMSRRLKPYIPDNHTRLELLKYVHREARRNSLPPELVLAVIHVESRFDQWAISRAGAMGYMQIMPFWLKEMGTPNQSLFDMKLNVRMGCVILRHYLNREDGNMTRALARYNGSTGSYRYPKLVFRALRNHWRVR